MEIRSSRVCMCVLGEQWLRKAWLDDMASRIALTLIASSNSVVYHAL